MRDGAYATPDKLDIRRALYRHADSPSEASNGRVRSVIDLHGDERIVDVGSGNGRDIGNLRDTGHVGQIIAVDLSDGMLRAIDAACDKVVGDAAALPLGDNIADVTLAMSMLYHVPDIRAAVAELRRVLRPGGTLLAATSSANDTPEITEVWSRALSKVAGYEIDFRRQSAVRFTQENGAETLGQSFSAIDVTSWRTTLNVPTAREIRDYADSGRDFYESQLPDPSRWPEAMDLIEQGAADRIEHDGVFTVTIKKCTFVCR
jgi:SAM-dependent methyltransferase